MKLTYLIFIAKYDSKDSFKLWIHYSISLFFKSGYLNFRAIDNHLLLLFKGVDSKLSLWNCVTLLVILPRDILQI